MVTTLSNDQKRAWITVELQQEYQDHSGFDLTRSHLAENLCNHFEGDLLMISAPGYANVVYFRCHASTGSSVVECRTRNQVSSGSNPSLLPFRILGIFVLSIDAPVHSAV